MKKTFKFTEKERFLIFHLIENEQDEGTFTLIDRIEQIVSERITPEQDTIKPYHEHGNSVASDRTESGQSADGGIAIMEILQPIHRHPFDAESGREMEIWYTHKDVWNAMTTYASQVCADRDARITEQAAELRFRHDRIGELNFEIDRLNESLAVMVRKNAELEKEVVEYKKSLIKLKSDLKSR